MSEYFFGVRFPPKTARPANPGHVRQVIATCSWLSARGPGGDTWN